MKAINCFLSMFLIEKKRTICIMLFVFLSYHGFSQCYWTQKADVGGLTRYTAIGFSVGHKGYICCGANTSPLTYLNDLWEYNPVTDTWSQKSNFPGALRAGAFSFVIGNKAYIGAGASGGGNPVYYNDFWEYYPATDTWTQKSNLPFYVSSATSFTLNGSGYVVTGKDNNGVKNDVWQYNPLTDTWTQKAPFGGIARAGALSFIVAGKAFVGTGGDATGANSYADFWEYISFTDTWVQKADFNGPLRNWAVGFALNEKWCIIGTGRSSTYLDFRKDVWSYNIYTDTWSQLQDFSGVARYGAVAFTIGTDTAYLGTGADAPGSVVHDFWEFSPNTSTIPIAGNNGPVCAGSTLSLTASTITGATYSWTGPDGFTSSLQSPTVSNNATSAMAGNYYVTTVVNGCTSIAGMTTVIVGNSIPPAPIITQNGSTLSSNAVSGNQWYNQDGIINGATNQNFTVSTNGDYYVIVTIAGCSSDTSNIIHITNAGIKFIEDNKTIKVYPNPAIDKVSVSCNNVQDLKIQFFNILGECVLQRELNCVTNYIDINSLSKGIYIIILTGSDWTLQSKLTKE